MIGLPILFKLLIAHFAGDFLLQPSAVVENRNRSLFSRGLAYHLLIHLACLVILFQFQADWWVVVAIIGSHAVIDLCKAGFEGGS